MLSGRYLKSKNVSLWICCGSHFCVHIRNSYIIKPKKSSTRYSYSFYQYCGEILFAFLVSSAFFDSWFFFVVVVAWNLKCIFWYTFDYAGGWLIKKFRPVDFWKQDYFFLAYYKIIDKKYKTKFLQYHYLRQWKSTFLCFDFIGFSLWSVHLLMFLWCSEEARNQTSSKSIFFGLII